MKVHAPDLPPASLVVRLRGLVARRPGLGSTLLAGASMQAFGHALLAAAGGGLARALAGGSRPMDAGSMVPIGGLGGEKPLLLGLALAGTLAAVVKTTGAALAGWAEARLAGEVGAEVRREVLDGVLSADGLRGPRHGDQGDTALRHTAAPVAALTTHVLEVERGIAQGVLGEVRGLLQLAPLAVLLVWLAPRLAASAAIAMTSFALIVLVTRRALKRGHARAARDASLLLSASDEAVKHADLWVTYGATARIRGHVAEVGARIVRAQARLRAHGALVSGASEVLGALALVLVVALAGRGMLGGVDQGTLVPFAVTFFMAYKPLREVVDARLARVRGEASLAAALAPVSRAKVDVVANAARASAWPLAELALSGVVGRHGRHAPLSVRIAPGSVVAIVGPTGVGKTSLVRALLGLELPRAGHVIYAGVTLDDQGAGPHARPFAWVPQDAPVLATTVGANVTLGVPEGKAADAEAAARWLERLGARRLAGGISDELVTDRALSGGERQLVAVARALATELPVLLLDEPTSALDPDAEAEVLRALGALRGERTLVLVTHRHAPLALADVVLRLSRVETNDADDGAGLDRHHVAPSEVAVDDERAGAAREREPDA